MRHKPKPYAEHHHTCEAHGMEFGRYYVVEVSFRPSNPVFRCIALNARAGGCVRLVSAGLEMDDEQVHLDQLAFFRVVDEIRSVKDRPSQYMPPVTVRRAAEVEAGNARVAAEGAQS